MLQLVFKLVVQVTVHVHLRLHRLLCNPEADFYTSQQNLICQELGRSPRTERSSE